MPPGIKRELTYITSDGKAFGVPEHAVAHEREMVFHSKVDDWIDTYAPGLGKGPRRQLKEALRKGFNDLQTVMGDVNSVNMESTE